MTIILNNDDHDDNDDAKNDHHHHEKDDNDAKNGKSSLMLLEGDSDKPGRDGGDGKPGLDAHHTHQKTSSQVMMTMIRGQRMMMNIKSHRRRYVPGIP